jgi:glycosyltransferase involved in cell wall biosynthesis
MISTEYPPMQGGVGRYCNDLVNSLRKLGTEVLVVSNKFGGGDLDGISPTNLNNSQVLLRLEKEIKPDLIHVQYEPGLYGIYLHPVDPRKTRTNIELFYHNSNTPIVTTFHSAYMFKQWMNLVVPLSGRRLGRFGSTVRMGYDYWTHLLNYRSFHLLNTSKIGAKRAGVVFSRYLSAIIPGSQLIYHGAEPSIFPAPDKNEARKSFSLPPEDKIALATGFMTATKGWDIIRKMKIPPGWKIVINTSRNHYNMERYTTDFEIPGIINLNRGYLNDKELSLLYYSVDALMLPYRVSSASGVMFSGLAHELPFISSNIEFFKEFSQLGLGICVKRKPSEFSDALLKLERDYERYKRATQIFSRNLLWEQVARKHLLLYKSIIDRSDSYRIGKDIPI